MAVDDQNYSDVLMYFVQSAGYIANIVFTVQIRQFWLLARSELSDEERAQYPLGSLYGVAVAVLIVPLIMNFVSSLLMARQIGDGDAISVHSKKWFKSLIHFGAFLCSVV